MVQYSPHFSAIFTDELYKCVFGEKKFTEAVSLELITRIHISSLQILNILNLHPGYHGPEEKAKSFSITLCQVFPPSSFPIKQQISTCHLRLNFIYKSTNTRPLEIEELFVCDAIGQLICYCVLSVHISCAYKFNVRND